ncbi:molybdopterin oxidoreductase family protein [Streptomyces sp. cg2]|uniref:molybdopterin oxidoreductase family protein n=1 Tax=Streptomyces sp. cg2 TaxID=3238799 RepID=UPI0034E2DED0
MDAAAIAPIETHCPYCALQCGMGLRPATGPGGPAVEVVERPAFPVNRGALCGKGRTAHELLAPGARLTSPLVRDADTGQLVPAGWDAALDRVAEGLRRAGAVYGRDAVGVFGGGGLTNEKAYALGKFARVVLGTSQIDYNGRFCMSSAGGPADYSGITYARIAAEDGVFWPCPAGPDDPAGPDAPADTAGSAGVAEGAKRAVTGAQATRGEPAGVPGHPGTPRLFLDRFATSDGRARFAPVTHRPADEEPDAGYPVVLTTGRVLAQHQSGAQTRRVAALNAAEPGPYVELHPRLADRLGIADGEPVAVVSRRGRAVAPARVSPAIRPDTVFMPFHWPGEGRANSLTNPALDPASRMPEFKVCAVRVERPGP